MTLTGLLLVANQGVLNSVEPWLLLLWLQLGPPKDLSDHQREKYAVATLTDCRSILDPVLSSYHFGFYHSAILNTHDVTARDDVWELANRCYASFSDAKNNNKHFTDMNDLNFLMCKAIDNPGLTPSSSMRTAFISIFEDPAIDESNKVHEEIGLVDYVGCSSVHGIGPTIAIFDTMRDGCLDCACVYPHHCIRGSKCKN